MPLSQVKEKRRHKISRLLLKSKRSLVIFKILIAISLISFSSVILLQVKNDLMFSDVKYDNGDHRISDLHSVARSFLQHTCIDNDNKLHVRRQTMKEQTKSRNHSLYKKSGEIHRMSGTVSCPCGKYTESSEYINNTLNFYANKSTSQHNDIDKLKKCFNLTLPLKESDPIECWPKMIIIPSHPTNGSGLARTLLQRVLGVHIF